MHFFSRMRRAVTAEIIQMKFCMLNPWLDVVIYFKRHPNWYRGLGGAWVQFSSFLLTLVLASYTAYCTTMHTRDAIPSLHILNVVRLKPCITE